MSKLQNALNKLELLKQYDREVKELEAMNKVYSELIAKLPNEKPIGITISFQSKNLSMGYNAQFLNHLVKDMILQNKAKIKSLKTKIVKTAQNLV